MADGSRAFDQRLTETNGTYTFEIVPQQGAESFDTINSNGVQRGGRPFIGFLQHRVQDVRIVLGEDLQPVITDNFVLIPHPGECDPDRDYRVVFTATRVSNNTVSGANHANLFCSLSDHVTFLHNVAYGGAIGI